MNQNRYKAVSLYLSIFAAFYLFGNPLNINELLIFTNKYEKLLLIFVMKCIAVHFSLNINRSWMLITDDLWIGLVIHLSPPNSPSPSSRLRTVFSTSPDEAPPKAVWLNFTTL
ncbi:hypothetical protein Misp06_03359 [Microbulbifer sp. NBRC 101763]